MTARTDNPSLTRRPSRTVLLAFSVALTLLLVAMIPSLVLAARSDNGFMLAVIVAATSALVLLDGVAIGLMIGARR